MRRQIQNERRVLNLADVGLPEVPVFGRYEYCSAQPGLTTHTHPRTVEICYLERGCQTYRVGMREYNLVGGDVFVTAPGEPHDTGGQVEDRGILYWLNLKLPKQGGSLLMLPSTETSVLITLLSCFPEPHFRGRPILKQILNEIFRLCSQTENPLRRVAIANQLIRCLLEVISCACRAEDPRCSPRIARLAERIRSWPEPDYSLKALAEEAGLSLSRFKTRFKREIGIAPREYILRCKMDAAKNFLLDRRGSVTDAAMLFGFSSSQYFATVFKRFTQQTPVEFCTKGPSVLLRPGGKPLRA